MHKLKTIYIYEVRLAMLTESMTWKATSTLATLKGILFDS